MDEVDSKDDSFNEYQPVKTNWQKFKPHLFSLFKNLAIILILVVAVDIYRGTSALERGSKAPSFTLEWLHNYVNGPEQIPSPTKPTLLYFSAPWCGVCQVTGNNFKYAESLLNTIGFDIKAVEVSLSYVSIQSLQKYSKDNGDKDFLKGNDEVLEAYKISSFPTFYFVSKNGEIRGATSGYTTSFGLVMRALLLLI